MIEIGSPDASLASDVGRRWRHAGGGEGAAGSGGANGGDVGMVHPFALNFITWRACGLSLAESIFFWQLPR